MVSFCVTDIAVGVIFAIPDAQECMCVMKIKFLLNFIRQEYIAIEFLCNMIFRLVGSIACFETLKFHGFITIMTTGILKKNLSFLIIVTKMCLIFYL